MAWVNHDIPFNHPAVKNAFQRFGAIALNPNYVVGGKTGILSIFFGDAPKPLFDQPPGCYLHHQATFISSFFPEDVILGEDVDIFPFPSIEPDLGTPLLVGGQIIGMFNDTPETRQLMEYLVSVEPHEILAGIKGSISPHKQVSLEVYPDPVTKRQAKLLLSDEQVIRYDASDQLPGAVGTGTFWTGIIDYVSGQDLDRILQDIETSWTSN